MTQLISFFVLAFLIAAPAFLVSGSASLPIIQLLLLVVGSYAPAVSALVVAAITQDLGSLRKRVLRWRVGWSWYLVALLLPAATWLIAYLVASILGRPRQISATSALALPVILLVNFGEEVGWRGFALPRLLTRYSPLASGFLLGLSWAAFHAPLYWTRPIEGLFYLAPLLPISTILTWLFIGSGESILVVTVFHTLFNTWAQVLLTGEAVRLLLVCETLALVLVAIYLVVRYGKKLSGSVPGRGKLIGAG